MMVRWHLVFEQLQQQPELVEDDLRMDIQQLTHAKDTGDKEQQVLRALQQRLGNFGLQRLLTGQLHQTPVTTNPDTGNPESDNPDTDNKSETDTAAPAKPVAEQVETSPDLESPKLPNAPEPAPTTLPEMEIHPESPTTAEPVPEENRLPIPEPATASDSLRTSDSLRKSALLLNQVLAHLPYLVSARLRELAEYFPVLSDSEQEHLLGCLGAAIQALPPADQERLMAELRQLPDDLLKAPLLARLLARWLNRVASPAPPSPPPEE